MTYEFGTDRNAFIDKLLAWERFVRGYEDAAEGKLSDTIKFGLLVGRSPEELKTHLLVQLPEKLQHDLARKTVENFITAGRAWERTAPMEVDLVRTSKGDYGKGKGEWGEKGKG